MSVRKQNAYFHFRPSLWNFSKSRSRLRQSWTQWAIWWPHKILDLLKDQTCNFLVFLKQKFKVNFFQQRITFQPVKIIATKSCCVASNLVTDCKLISKTYYFLCKKLQVHLWNITNLLVMTKFLQANIFSENSRWPSNLLKTICKKVPKWQDWFVITCSVQRFFIQCIYAVCTAP